MNATAQRALDTALRLFNAQGYARVSLQDIAQAMGISRGNLAYHFRDKEALLAALSGQLWDQLLRERARSSQLPSFANLHQEVQLYYRMQRAYAFIFTDPHLLQHPLIRQQFREQTALTLQANKEALAFALRLGNLKPEPFPGCYHHIAFTTWMLTFFWLPQQLIRGEQTGEDGEKYIWSLLLPHFTDKGLAAFRAHFGEDYLAALGPPFEQEIRDLPMF
ncbi:MAG: TetR/AcrR family transcriptional regulator [Bacteroidetes bacterium]|nr:MAG: TetR/AcrR family transcriptional regulator [Bacteroidota bacterium]